MSHRFPCQHETWARGFTWQRSEGVTLMGSNPPCPWCARDTGRELADGMMTRLVNEKNAALDALRQAREALKVIAHGCLRPDGSIDINEIDWVSRDTIAAIDAVLGGEGKP